MSPLAWFAVGVAAYAAFVTIAVALVCAAAIADDQLEAERPGFCDAVSDATRSPHEQTHHASAEELSEASGAVSA